MVNKTEGPRDSRSTTPAKIADTTPPPPSGDYTYTVEICMNLRESMGRVVEAVETLKRQSEKQGEKIDKQGEKIGEIAEDIHAAKVLGATLGVIGAILGFLVKLLLDYLHK